MATGEDQSEYIVFDLLIHITVWILRISFYLQQWLIGQGLESGLTPDLVDGFKPARGNEPCSRMRRNAIFDPLLQSDPEGIMHGIFGEVKVTDQANQGGQHLARFFAIDLV